MQNLSNNLEAALKVRAENGGFEVSVYTGQGDEEKANPSLVIHAESGAEMPQDSGNFQVAVNIALRMTAETAELNVFNALARDVMGQFMVSELASVLSSEATDLHVFGITGREFRATVEESHWMSTLTFTAYCCRTDL